MPKYTNQKPDQLKMEFLYFVRIRTERPLSHAERSDLLQLACVMATNDAASHSSCKDKLLSNENKKWLRDKCDIYIA